MSVTAKVTMEFVISSLCNEEDLNDISLEGMVTEMIESEGIIGICDDLGTITKIERMNGDNA